MKNRFLRCFSVIAFMAAGVWPAMAQRQVKLSTGSQSLGLVSDAQVVRSIKSRGNFNGRYYFVARLGKMPAASSAELQLHTKIAANTFLVSTAAAPDAETTRRLSIEEMALVKPELKIALPLRSGSSGRFRQNGRLPLLLGVVPGVKLADVKQALQQKGVSFTNNRFEKNNLLSVSAPAGLLNTLADAPYLLYLQPQANDQALNEKTRFMSGAFLLNASLANGGYDLHGKGVTVGVGDDADPSLHPDLQDKIINRTPGIVNNHGAHVTGTIAGGGVLQPDRKGFAPMATVISQFFSGIWANAETYANDFGMVLTNNSYGAQAGDCGFYGVYDLYSGVLDAQSLAIPQMLHVFASGNSGDETCAPLPTHYGTVLGAYQSAKNVITVGRTDYPQLAGGSSSSGPVKDGRLKPEITALGIVESCDGGSGYWGAYGTSMSAPGVTGALALLYERYRQLHGGANPQGALMKPVLLNGARDAGTPGPDYRHGFGFTNLANSIRILNNQQFFSGSLAQNGQQENVITVASGAAQLKVMLYWHDLPAAPLAAKALVNDLDLEVVRPDGVIVYPKILHAAQPEAAATEGADHLNNVEQVVIDAPLAGNYTLRVKGFDVGGSATQAFYTVYDAVPAELILRTPVKGDNWSVSAPDEWAVTGVVISWDDEGTGTGAYKLEYSLDSGSTWTTILDGLKDTCRYYGWRPPANTATNGAMVRITKNTGNFSSTSPLFTIINRPNYSLAANPCEGYITVNWTAVSGADDYEVLMKQGPEMVPVAVVSPPALTYTISGLSRDSVYYVAVRARKGGVAGRWIKSNGRQPNSGPCSAIPDGDLKLDSIVSPIYGRDFTSNTLGNNESVKVRIKNLDNAGIAAGSYTIKLSVDGGSFVAQAGSSAVAALGTYTHTFTGIDLSAKGPHSLVAVVQNTALTDKVAANDTFRTVVYHLPNEPISLAATHVEDYEAAPAFSLSRTIYGFTNADRWDYFNSDQYGRARSFVNTGIARSGSKAITLDVSKSTPYVKNPTNYLQGTFNLSSYTTNDDVRLDFYFKQHGSAQVPNAANRVWVRGSDTQKWIEVYDLSANQTDDAGIWKYSGTLELNDILSAASPVQQFGSSFQVRFGQYAQYSMADNVTAAGYSFDDVKLYIAVNDMQMVSIDTPVVYSCNLSSATPVKITIRNSTNQPVSNVPVSYRVNGGAAVSEIITQPIPANSSVQYIFSKTADFSAGDVFTLETSVNMPGDNVTENDTVAITIYSQPTISNFPYLEDFESSNGHFYTGGSNSSWEWGAPASIKIKIAANGNNAWKTRLAGNYNDREYSQLNSPCFNISGLQNPMLSFSLTYDIEDCTPYGLICDQAWVEYSTDGINWTKLGANGQGTNWYDVAGYNIWTRNAKTWWHVASIPLPQGLNNLRLRWVFASDEATNYEGVAIDDIHIYDRVAPMYYSPGTSNAITKIVSGNNPVHFTDNGKLVASLLPNGYNLGNTEVKAYIFNGPVRNNGSQYYGNRNITVKPSNHHGTPVTVRFYFTDKEADSLRLANSCAVCPNPLDYTHIGVTQYTDADKTKEDSTLANNNTGITRYLHDQDLRMVPYDSGYYAEFSVNSFSEFWLNDGRGADIPLPGKWMAVYAVAQPGSVVKVSWTALNEVNISAYEVQASINGSSGFETVGRLAAKNLGQASYTFLDQRPSKQGYYYYRIRQVDGNGNEYFSPVVMVHFASGGFEVSAYPNPVKDKLLLQVESNGSRKLDIILKDIAGKLLLRRTLNAGNGITQDMLDARMPGMAAGVYMLTVSDGKTSRNLKIVKQ